LNKKTGLGVALALFLSASAAQAGVQEGVEAWRNGDYARAIAEWQPLAETGDPDAQFNLGQAYKLGRGVPQDMERARELFGSAARQGHLQAEANYGLILFQNGNREDAMPWIVRAANQGEPRAQYIYGTALFNGDLAPRDWPRAYAMMTNASAAGLPQAAASLEQMDRYIPPDQRERGTALAAELNSASATTDVATAPPARVPAPTPTISQEPPPASPPPAAPPAAIQPRPQPTAPLTTQARSEPWRIQLGSFRERARAEILWRSLNGRVSEISGLQPFLVRAGPYTRLQAGPFATRAAAQRACAAAVRAGSDCITVRRQ
jgi:cell division septation protein DedD